MAKGQKATPMAQWSQQRRENAIKYNQDHYSVVGSKLPRDVADAFRALCKASGVSVSAALSVFIRAAIQAGTLDMIPPAAPVLPADVSAVGVSGIVPAGDACAVPDPCAIPADAAPEIVPAPEKSPAAGENSQAGDGTPEIPSNSQKSQPSPREIQEITRPAQCGGAFSPSDCTNTNPQPEMEDFSSKAPRAPARVGNSAAPAFPPEENPRPDSTGPDPD